MPVHSARSLFDTNIKSASDCLTLYDGVSALRTRLVVSWVLRAGVVFVVSALDTYFHDKIKYRVGQYSLANLPPALAKFEVPVSDLTKWDKAERKGNVLRNWVTEDLGTRPLQSPTAIAEALKLCGVTALWDTIEPNKQQRVQLLEQLNALVKRRNQIAHEGDRETSRRSGKRLRTIERKYLEDSIAFAKTLVDKIETAFPR
ncbi:MAG: hypothetical protein FJX72_05805 [Armatimonadetes bacterium]|nr:hypothetical protein [Armatimonadota bacterium]